MCFHEYIGGYHEYIGGISWCMWGISWVHQGNTMSTLGGYYEYIGDIMMHVGEQVGKNLSISVENPDILNIPWCTHDIPSMYSQYLPMYWTSPDVLMVSPHISWYPPDVLMMCPRMYWTSPDVLMISPTGIMISPDVLNTPWCTHEIPSDVLNTHYTGWSWKGAQVLNFCTCHLSLLTQNLNLFYLAYFHFKMS